MTPAHPYAQTDTAPDHAHGVTLVFPNMRCMTPNERRAAHHMVQARRIKGERKWAQLYGLSAGIHQLPLPLTITLTRIAPRPLDDDNVCGSFKAVRDGIADALGVDDRSPQLTWRYAQETGRGITSYAVRVDIRTEGT